LGEGTARASSPCRLGWSGPAAGPIRNQLMLDKGKPDVVLAFPARPEPPTW
jgi:hypothetical protein